jgi:hypothetical protein
METGLIIENGLMLIRQKMDLNLKIDILSDKVK